MLIGMLQENDTGPLWRKMVGDMPERIYVDPGGYETAWCYEAFEGFTEYIRADKCAELEATIAETVEKAAFVDEMCKALGVTFEELVNDDSVKARVEERDDAV